MKKSQLILKTFSIFLLCLMLSSSVSFAGNGSNLEIQYIAIHYGDSEMATVLDASEFSKFQFYLANGNVY